MQCHVNGHKNQMGTMYNFDLIKTLIDYRPVALTSVGVVSRLRSHVDGAIGHNTVCIQEEQISRRCSTDGFAQCRETPGEASFLCVHPFP